MKISTQRKTKIGQYDKIISQADSFQRLAVKLK